MIPYLMIKINRISTSSSQSNLPAVKSYKSRGLCAIFHLLDVASIQGRLLVEGGFYLRAAFMQNPESAKPAKAVWHM